MLQIKAKGVPKQAPVKGAHQKRGGLQARVKALNKDESPSFTALSLYLSILRSTTHPKEATMDWEEKAALISETFGCNCTREDLERYYEPIEVQEARALHRPLQFHFNADRG